MITALQAENAKMSATSQAHDQLIQTLRLRIARLKKQVFGKSSEKIEREIEQLELAPEDLLIAAAEGNTAPIGEADEAGSVVPLADTAEKIMRRRPRVSEKAVRERRELDPGSCCPECGGELRLVGEDASEILDMIAAQMKVIEVARPNLMRRVRNNLLGQKHPFLNQPADTMGRNTKLFSGFGQRKPFAVLLG
ncbi:DNA repair exonuclease SbcCD ATPase subunit [Rhizobium leguminosarum]|nr:DNA repair exonuclease SbcCD ATPase subunit [Rhizobium leguminosarum]